MSPRKPSEPPRDLWSRDCSNMTALPLPQLEGGPSLLRLWTPEVETRDAHRSINPVRSPKKKEPASGQQALWEPGVDAETLAYAQVVTETFRDVEVPVANRQWVRDHLSVRQFYTDWMDIERRKKLEDNDVAPGTLQKERQAINRWEKYSRPEDWPVGKDWTGVPIGAVSGAYMKHVIRKMFEGLAPCTIKSTWGHLRAIFKFAVQVRALDCAPEPDVSFESEDAEEDLVTVYKPDEIRRAYQALSAEPDLQVSFVLACNAGMRPVDLYSLETDKLDVESAHPTITFKSRKTGKVQAIPLAPITVMHLRRLNLGGRYVFPGRSNPTAKDPERSRPARARRRRVQSLFMAAGLTFEKPNQVARATCNTRLNRARQGAGDFVLGHSLTLNSKSYMDPSDLIFEAIHAVPQPECFSEWT